MGIDAYIYFKSKTTTQRLERSLPDGYVIRDVIDGDYNPKDATHFVETYERHYGKGYERGSWPNICSALMLLMNSPDIDAVWYFGDNDAQDEKLPIGADEICEMTRHFIAHGERPYRGGWPSNATDNREPQP